MRIAIAFCLLAVLCTVYASDSPSGDLGDLKLQINNMIWSVKDIISQIERVRIETEEDTRVTVTKRWWQQQDDHRDYVNLLLTSMRREVNNAKLRGVDAQECYKVNSWGLNAQTDTAYKDGLKCKMSAESSMKESLEFLDSLISFGETLVKDLNGIIPNCHDKDSHKVRSCVMKELAKMDEVVKSLKEDAKYIRYNAMAAANYVVLQATKCLNKAYLVAHIESQEIMMSHTRCVQEALKKEKKDLAESYL